MPEAIRSRELKAVLFDVDGTLYRQAPLRRAMALRLALGHALRPLRGLKTLKMIGAYRRAQEELRDAPAGSDLAQLQLDHASRASGIPAAAIAACVAKWMEETPLPILGRYVHPGVAELLKALRAKGLKLGVLSDYPAEAKLRALGLEGAFDVILCAQSREVSAFKPNPRGLVALLERLGVDPQHALYVGDRAEVDAAAALAAKIPCAILTSRPTPADASFISFAHYAELRRAIIPGADSP